MPQTSSTIINETDWRQVLWGTETTLGTPVTPTYRTYGTFTANKQRPLVNKPEKRRSADGLVNPKVGTTTFDGTYSDELSFEDGACLLRYGACAATTGVSDGQATPGYTYTYRPGDSTKISSATVQDGVDGLPFANAGVQFGEFTISGDIDDTDGTWKFSAPMMMTDRDMMTQILSAQVATGGSTTTIVKAAAGWTVNAYQGLYVRMMSGTAANIGNIRLIASNDATTLTLDSAMPAAVVNTDVFEIMAGFTPAIAERSLNYIQTEGTQLFIADNLAGLATATNEISDKMISFSVTQNNNTKLKKFMDNVGKYSTKRGRGNRFISGTIKMEFDDWNEYKKFESVQPTQRAIKIQQIGGPVINASPETKYTAAIIVPKCFWNAIDANQDRNGNIVANYEFWTYRDTSIAYPISYEFKNRLAALP